MNAFSPGEKNLWIALLQTLADDEWVAAHRGSEWLALAPDLEEDLAYSSINQDEMGHAHFYYTLLAELGATDPEHMVFARTVEQWRHACVLEITNGDWAGVVVLRYFYEVFDDIRTEFLMRSPWPPLQDGLRKIRREESYHLEHFTTWFELLANGTRESRHRLQNEIFNIWPKVGDFFSWGELDSSWRDLRLPDLAPKELQRAWEKRIRETLQKADLTWPGSVPSAAVHGRKGRHTNDFKNLLAIMTEVFQSDVTAHW